MRRFIVLFLLLILQISEIKLAKADSITLDNGETITGKINHIVSGIVDIKTKDGIKTIIREVSENQARDIVEIGYFKKNKYLGYVFLLCDDILEMATPTGNLKINRFKVRNIILSQ